MERCRPVTLGGVEIYDFLRPLSAKAGEADSSKHRQTPFIRPSPFHRRGSRSRMRTRSPPDCHRQRVPDDRSEHRLQQRVQRCGSCGGLCSQCPKPRSDGELHGALSPRARKRRVAEQRRHETDSELRRAQAVNGRLPRLALARSRLRLSSGAGDVVGCPSRSDRNRAASHGRIISPESPAPRTGWRTR